MAKLLAKLYEYHQLTTRLYSLNQQIESQRRRARVQERRIAEHGKQIEEMHEEIRRAQVAAGEAELDLKTRDANLDKLRGQLNTAKTNKEYTTLLREINTFKADTGKLEENALRRMSDVDELKGKLAELEKELGLERRRLDELKAQASAREQELSEQIQDVTQKLEATGGELPADVRAQFNRVAKSHEGEAMAPIVRSHPKRAEYICSGCNLGVTLEQVSALRSRDEIQTCNCCGRLLYLGESALVD